MTRTFSSELIALIKKNKFREAMELLRSFSKINATEQERTLSLFELMSNDLAYSMLEQIMNNGFTDKLVRAKVLACIIEQARSKSNFIIIFLQTATTDEISEEAPFLNHILHSETDTYILLQTLIAIGHSGRNEYTNTIADFIYYDNRELMLAAIDGLVNMGTTESFRKLWEASLTTKSDDDLIATLATIPIVPKDLKKQNFLNTKDIEQRIGLLIAMLTSKHYSVKKSASKQILNAYKQMGGIVIFILTKELKQNPANTDISDILKDIRNFTKI